MIERLRGLLVMDSLDWWEMPLDEFVKRQIARTGFQLLGA
jgi:hypothetical protein